MKKSINKNTIVSLLLLSVIAIIVYRITPVYVEQNLKVVVSKNRVSISNINQVRDITNTRIVNLDKLNLFNNGKFGHAKLGNIAKASDDFFIDVDQMFSIHKTGNYQFLIGSDDGFSLTIDGKKVCEHLQDRPYSVQSCNVFLNSGKHRFQVSYFQGFGQSGFSVQYQTNDGKVYWFGEDSPDLTLN
jgi:PA14 domain